MSQRSDWTFEYSQEEVADAAAVKRLHHNSRVTFWEGELTKAREAIDSTGLEVREHQVTGGVRHDVIIDPTLSARLSECQQKVKAHKDDAVRYARWERTMRRNPVLHVQLDHDDVVFFGLEDPS